MGYSIGDRSLFGEETLYYRSLSFSLSIVSCSASGINKTHVSMISLLYSTPVSYEFPYSFVMYSLFGIDVNHGLVLGVGILAVHSLLDLLLRRQ